MSSEQPDSVVESLRQERLIVQKKTFTKWVNIHLQKYGLEINDLFQDLGDGCRLMKLLESLTGEKLGKPAKGNSRIKKIENVSRCLMFLHSKKMRLENISSEDIVDGKPHLILGLIWTIILRCEIDSKIEGVTPDLPLATTTPVTRQVPDLKIAKESLLLWCQTKTDGYPRVHVRDFHRSWRDGLAFNALIHSHIPTLVNYNALKQEEHIYNLDNAFTIASKYIGVPRLLDPEDVDTDNPDEKSILVYVSTFCKGLGKHRDGMTGGKRIANVICKTTETDKLKNNYCETASSLLNWINSKVEHFATQEPLESLENIQQEIQQFKTYRTVEKPEQSEKKNEVEALFFSIQMQRLGSTGWIPPGNVSPTEIEKAWSELQRAEHEHEISIRSQLKEQERLENLAYKFETKRSVREGYIEEIQKILTDPNYGASIKQSDATFKKHEAIRTGIIAREIMMKDLFKIAETLIESNYRRKDNIISWKNETEEKWNYVLRLLEAYDEKFSHLRQVISTLEEMDSILDEMQQLQAEMNAEAEPLDVTSSLQKLALKEVQVASWGETVTRYEKKIGNKKEIKENNLLQTQVKKLKQAHANLTEACRNRREMLEHQLKVKEHNEQVESIMAWLFEKKLYCTSDVYCKDLASALLLQKKHKALGSELKVQKEFIENIEEDKLNNAFTQLEDLWKEKEKQIALAVETYQYTCDADECKSWITENMHLLSTLDFGTDELTSEALLRRHTHMETKILAYSGEIKSLRETSESLLRSLSHYSEVQDSKIQDTEKSKNQKNSTNDVYPNPSLTAEHIASLQMEMESAYNELQNNCQNRKVRLHHHSMYFKFKDRCDEVEKWMREKERIMDLNDFGDESEEIEKRFEEYITDMLAHGLIIDELASIASQLEEEKAEQSNTAKILLDDVQRRWQHLRQLTLLKAQNLKGFTSVLLAHRMCDESISWLNDTFKSQVVDSVDDIKTFDDLRRKQEAIDRDLFLVEERVKQALVLAENVSTSYPDQEETMHDRVQTLTENWEQYQIKCKDRKKNIEKLAGFQIFKSSANSLIEWSNDVQCKCKIREKISNMEVAQSVAKDHKDLRDEIEIQEDRFDEIEELGQEVSQAHPEVIPLIKKMTEARKTVHELWHVKQTWLSQSLDLQIFNREANQLQSLCSSQNALLEVVELGENLSDVEILIRHHESFLDTMKAQRGRFITFDEMADKLIASDHDQKEYIRSRQEEIASFRAGVLQRANERKLRLQQEYFLQEFKVDAQEMITWIAEKNKRALELLQSNSSAKLSSKLKRLETLEAELTANAKRLQNVYVKGEQLAQECDFAREDLEKMLEDIENAWNLLCERLDINRHSLNREKELQEFYMSAELVIKKLDDIKQSAESSHVGNDPRSVKNLLKNQEILESEEELSREKASKVVELGHKLIEESDSEENDIWNLIEVVERKSEAIKEPLVIRRDKLETCWKFHQFKSEVERELMWISDQILLLSTDSQCQNLLDAQKLQKKLENLEVTLECHQKIVEKLSKEVLVLVAEKECVVNVTRTCEEMQTEWNKLLGIFDDKKSKSGFDLKAQMVYSEASEIDAWIAEKKQILNSTDYGKDEDSVVKFLTKQKDTELEIDSYKGLVEELANQAQPLIELNNSHSKIVKNRMEIIDRDMKTIQNLCSVRRQKLLEAKNQKEFEKETEELGIWISEQMAEATSEDYGEDYEHILLLNSNFEFFRARVEAGSKRIIQYEDFAKRLINSKCIFVENVTESLKHLSSRWSELLESLEARAFKLEAAAEIHRYHRDVTDILGRIHNYYQALPNDLGSSLAHAQQLAKKHDAIENELLGIEAQVHLLLEDSQRLQDTYPGGNEEHIQMQVSLVIENWNSLQQKVASRKANLIASQRIHKFLSLVREEENWSKQICFELESDNIPRDVEQIASQHQISETEIETRLSNYESLSKDGESLLEYNLFQNQINEKLKMLTDIMERVKKAWNIRCELIRRTKAVILFFNEAKQIQTYIATKEVQLCGSETKETVEDLECALKKHSEYQKAMNTQVEKFAAWEQQGKNLLRQNVPESERIQKKLEDLSSRIKRLLNFLAERCETFSNSLRLAKYKRDTIEVELWIKEKKNKLRTLLKDYKQLNADEKIKCLQKQQAIQAEIKEHECIIQRIIQQKKKIPQAGEELNVRVELILENWDEVKKSADRMGRELKEAQDMLVIHGYFEKAESWIKEKELLIQKNDPGKDYEHCVALQAKLDDKNSSNTVDAEFMQEMRRLAEKLSRVQNQDGVYIRYERIHERWNYLTEEIALYRKKLRDAAEVHAFIKDMDDTIERIREKSMFLRAKEEAQDLRAAERMQRKFEEAERDLSAIENKIKKQCAEGDVLATHHELAAGKIVDKMNQVEREYSELKIEKEEKRKSLHAQYISLKFIKDVNDMEKIVADIVLEMDYGDSPNDSADATSLIEAHNDYKAEVIACEENIKLLENAGEAVLRIPGVLVEEVGRRKKSLAEMKKDLWTSWDRRLKLLIHLRDMETFIEKSKQIETWFATKEAFLANEDVGDSMSSVEALIRKHENFENNFATHFDKLQELEKLASHLSQEEDGQEVETWYENLCQRKDRLLQTSAQRGNVLRESKALQELLLEIYEVSNWMKEKIRVVSDEPHKDLRNILSKRKKHATLAAEINSNHSRVQLIVSKGDELLKDDHFASEKIHHHIESLGNLWQTLTDCINQQESMLNDAHSGLIFKEKLEDINNELDEAEAQINIDDYVQNVASIEQEIEKLQGIEKDVEEISKKLRTLLDASEKFDHYSKEEILSSLTSTTERYQNVEKSIAQKSAELEESLSLAKLDEDVNDELSWIDDNIAMCQSEEYFVDVTSVKVLQQKLQALETEMASREPLINSIIERGIRMNNPTAATRVEFMDKQFKQLADAITLKRLRLSDALEAQTYYFEVAQAEIWIKEKMSQVSSCDSASDVYSVQQFQKKLNTIEAATVAFKQNIMKLEELCSNLEGRIQNDADNLRQKQEELNNKYEELTCCILKKIALLKEEEEFLTYQRDVNSIIPQLRNISNTASSSETGRDVEHVESLLRKAELFRNKLYNYGKTVDSLQQRAKALTDGAHSESSQIKQLLADLEDAWMECTISAETRYNGLEQAKQIHSFNKSADETISWIYEKDVALSSEDFGHDLQSIQTLLKHHETLEADLKAIEEQVEALHSDVNKLSEQFPDSQESLEDKFSVVTEAWNRCSENAHKRKEKLLQAEQMQSYFEEGRDFQAWIREMSALITQAGIPDSVATAEALLAQHGDYKSDIDSQVRSFYKFEARGQEIVDTGHFMAEEVEERLKNLRSSFDDLLSLWQERKREHELNLSLQKFYKKTQEVDRILETNKHYLGEDDGNSLEDVEFLLRKHDQFEQKLNLCETKCQELQKYTEIEEEMNRQKEEEARIKCEEEKLLEQRKLEEFKKKEEERLLEERRKERADTEILVSADSDDMFLPHEEISPKEQVFKRIGSRRFSPDPTPDHSQSRPQTPVIPNNPFTIPNKGLPEATAEGFLHRKQETFAGGKRSTDRSWKNYYTVLCGHLLCFFKDKKSFKESFAAKPPVSILQASCSIPKDYHKKKYVFRLEPTDSSSFLFEAPSAIKRDEWMQKISFNASLTPKMQLHGYGEESNTNTYANMPPVKKQYEATNEKEYKNVESTKKYDDKSNKNKYENVTYANSYVDACGSDREEYYNTSGYDLSSRKSFVEDSEESLKKDSEEHIYQELGRTGSFIDALYTDSDDLSSRSATITSYDEELQSAKSSFSQLSYRTAHASESSISTIRDDVTPESSDEDNVHSMPEPRRKSEIFGDPAHHSKNEKGKTLPREKPPKKESKRKWFSLKRK